MWINWDPLWVHSSWSILSMNRWFFRQNHLKIRAMSTIKVFNNFLFCFGFRHILMLHEANTPCHIQKFLRSSVWILACVIKSPLRWWSCTKWWSMLRCYWFLKMLWKFCQILCLRSPWSCWEIRTNATLTKY